MAVLVIGGLLVLALVGWAVARSMNAPQTASTVPTTTFESTPPTPTSMPTETVANPMPGLTATAPVSTLPPVASATQPQEAEKAAVHRISAAELRQQVASNAVTLVDVRDMVSYGNGHIPGALHIPFARLEGETQYLPKDKPIVAYCT